MNSMAFLTIASASGLVARSPANAGLTQSAANNDPAAIKLAFMTALRPSDANPRCRGGQVYTCTVSKGLTARRRTGRRDCPFEGGERAMPTVAGMTTIAD